MLRQSPKYSKTLLQQSRRSSHITRAFSQSSPTLQWEGRKTDEHVTNTDHELDIQSQASKSGKRDRATGDGAQQAAVQKDTGSHNQRAEKDNPEAPKPVIGMNDERGSKGH
ncbi:MAG: hypothetical protein M1837_004942 [Sclerophora amabilis]|nr:MAG: hypothetical protein M1837_004942 [Sclerophora amabilis]